MSFCFISNNTERKAEDVDAKVPATTPKKTPESIRTGNEAMSDATGWRPAVEMVAGSDGQHCKKLIAIIQLGHHIEDIDMVSVAVMQGKQLRLAAPRSVLMTDMDQLFDGMVAYGVLAMKDALKFQDKLEGNYKKKRSHLREAVCDVCCIPLLVEVDPSKVPLSMVIQKTHDSSVLLVIVDLPGNAQHARKVTGGVVHLP